MPLTYDGLMVFVLCVLGSVLLVFLIFAVKNLSDSLMSLKRILGDNEAKLKEAVECLPGLLKNLEGISQNANDLMEEVSPDIANFTKNASDISERMGSVSSTVESTALKAADTLDVVSGSISDTAYAFSSNVNSIDRYIGIVLEVLEQIKAVLKRK